MVRIFLSSRNPAFVHDGHACGELHHGNGREVVLKLRAKLILGFASVLLVFAIAIGIAVVALGAANQGFSDYRQMAINSNLISSLEGDMLMVRLHVKDYILTRQSGAQEAYREYFTDLQGYLDEAQQNITDPQRAEMVESIDKHMNEYDAYFLDLVEHANLINEEFDVTLNIVGPNMEVVLTNLLESVDGTSQLALAQTSASAMRSLLLGRLYVVKFDQVPMESNANRVEKEFADLGYLMSVLDNLVQTGEQREQVSQLRQMADSYYASFQRLKIATYELVDIEENHLNILGPQIAQETDELSNLVTAAQNTLGPELQLRNTQSIIFIAIVALVALVLVVVVTVITTASVLGQLGADPKIIEAVMQRVAIGDLNIRLEQYHIQKPKGVFASVMDMVHALLLKAENLETVASGNLALEVSVSSEHDRLGISLQKMKESLNELLSQVNTAVSQVNAGADQISQSSQDLSQGATEQASSIEEITSAITEINSMSSQNADGANNAHHLARQAMENANSGKEKMDELNQIMQRINISADEINKVVKIIDDIAFQINLLALNANVEAARAGKYGKGFAVVAEEVRNLAVRSAEAVKETTQMVEETVSNIGMGSKAAQLTSEQLNSIVEGTGSVAELLSEIAASSAEQAQGIRQINTGLDQIDQTTQSNTASAEQSAAASEELAGQAQQLLKLVSQFTLDSEYQGQKLLSGPPSGAGHSMKSRHGEEAHFTQGSGPSGGRNAYQAHSAKGMDDDAPEHADVHFNPAEAIRLDGDFEDF